MLLTFSTGGQLHDIYESTTDSRYEVVPLPPYIRDPDSNFSALWDLAQVLLLFYVSVIVPLRAGFKARCCNNQHGCSPPLVMFALSCVCSADGHCALELRFHI